MKKKLYVLTYDHGGFVLWADGVKPRLKEISEWMRKYPKLKIGLDYESFTFDEFSKIDPEAVDLCKELLSKYPERIGLGATTYGQPLSLFISEESNVRQLTYAIRTNMKYFGKSPTVYAISEFALNNQTPQLISLCGYSAAILRSHVMGYGYPRTFDCAWGKWIGKDGTSIPAVPTYDRQGRGFNCTTVDNWILSRWPYDTDISLEEFEEMFTEYSPLLASRYDDLTQKIEGVTKHIEEKGNYEYVLLEDIPDLYGKAEVEMKTTDNDFHTQMPWGYCGNEIFNGGRKTEVNVVQAEKLNAVSVMFGGKPLCNELEEAWKNTLINQHHDVMICGLLDLARRFIPASLEYSDKVKNESLKVIKTFLGNNLNGRNYINLHSFRIDEWIDYNGEIQHISLPPFTIGTPKIVEADYKFEWSVNDSLITTPNYIIKLSNHGIDYIKSLSNECLLDNNSNPLFTALIDEKECRSVGEWQVDCKKTGVIAKYIGSIGSVPFEFTMKLLGSSGRIDCETRFEVHGQRIGSNKNANGLKDSLTVNGHIHPEKLCLNLNLKLDSNRKMFRDLPFSISEWSGDIRKTEDYWYKKAQILYDEKVSAEESFNSTTHLEGIYWLCLRDERKGFAVLNRGCMGAAVNGNKVYIPLVYSNDYLCGTRILDGVYTDEFSFVPFDSSVSNADIHREAMSYNYQPTVIDNGACNKEYEFKIADFMSTGGEVIMTALYPENGRLYARFCNFSDEKAVASFSADFCSMCDETDLLGNTIKKTDCNKIEFKPWEIKTITLLCTNK